MAAPGSSLLQTGTPSSLVALLSPTHVHRQLCHPKHEARAAWSPGRMLSAEPMSASCCCPNNVTDGRTAQQQGSAPGLETRHLASGCGRAVPLGGLGDSLVSPRPFPAPGDSWPSWARARVLGITPASAAPRPSPWVCPDFPLLTRTQSLDGGHLASVAPSNLTTFAETLFLNEAMFAGSGWAWVLGTLLGQRERKGTPGRASVLLTVTG